MRLSIEAIMLASLMNTSELEEGSFDALRPSRNNIKNLLCTNRTYAVFERKTYHSRRGGHGVNSGFGRVFA
jgi:hypothetical protein